MNSRYIDEEDLPYIAQYAYIEALQNCTISELNTICNSVGLYPVGNKQNYLSAIEDYRKNTVERKGFHV